MQHMAKNVCFAQNVYPRYFIFRHGTSTLFFPFLSSLIASLYLCLKSEAHLELISPHILQLIIKCNIFRAYSQFPLPFFLPYFLSIISPPSHPHLSRVNLSHAPLNPRTASTPKSGHILRRRFVVFPIQKKRQKDKKDKQKDKTLHSPTHCVDA